MIILANGHHPIKAWRIKYFDDKVLKPIFQAQKGPLPGPDPKDIELRSMRGELMLATSKITELAQKVDGGVTKRSRVKGALPHIVLEQVGKKSSDNKSANNPDKTAPVIVRRRSLNPNLASGIAISTDDAAVKAIVVTTEKVQTISPDDDGLSLEAS